MKKITVKKIMGFFHLNDFFKGRTVAVRIKAVGEGHSNLLKRGGGSRTVARAVRFTW